MSFSSVPGIIGNLGSMAAGYYGAQAQGASSAGWYKAQAIAAQTEAESLANQYKIGAINFILQGQKENAEYESKAIEYEVQGLSKKAQASIYDTEAATALIQKSVALRNADSLGASALEAVRAAGDAEEKLREQGRLFRGQQRAAIAAGGTDVGTGNALDILRETDEGIESDSAAIRYQSQKERYSLLVQQRNMWLNAEIEQFNSESYKVAAENLRSAAEVSSMGAETMRKLGAITLEESQEGSDLYNKFAEYAIQSGNLQYSAYQQMADIAESSANAAATASIISGVGNIATGLIGTFSSANSESGNISVQGTSGATIKNKEISQDWDYLAESSGIYNFNSRSTLNQTTSYKSNSFAMPFVSTYSSR